MWLSYFFDLLYYLLSFHTSTTINNIIITYGQIIHECYICIKYVITAFYVVIRCYYYGKYCENCHILTGIIFKVFLFKLVSSVFWTQRSYNLYFSCSIQCISLSYLTTSMCGKRLHNLFDQIWWKNFMPYWHPSLSLIFSENCSVF